MPIDLFRRKARARDIVHRWEGNPLLRLEDLDFPCADVWSAGVACLDHGILLLVTIEHLKGQQSLHLARKDERNVVHVDPTPFLAPCEYSSPCGPHESDGIMDGRVTRIGDVFYITYLAKGAHGFRTGLATTEDFVTVKRHGLISEPDTKAAALFPEKIGGRYALLQRPAGGSIWICYSEDLVHWGGHQILLSPRAGFWDSARIGAGAPPITIEEGWLLLYYGVRDTASGPLFRLGAAILDKEDPTQLVSRSNIPILAPREAYERIGDSHNIVFTTGAFVGDSDIVNIIYCGAASCLCLGTTALDGIREHCSRSKEEF